MRSSKDSGPRGIYFAKTKDQFARAVVDDLKTRFDQMNKFIASRGGWITSVPGDPAVVFEALPGSTLPAELRNAGHDVFEIGDGERILAHAIEQKLTLSSSGAYLPLAEGSTAPVALVKTHAGITRIARWSLSLAP